MTSAARSSVQGSTDAAYSSKPVVARSMKSRLWSPAWMISRADRVGERDVGAHVEGEPAVGPRAEEVRRGSTHEQPRAVAHALRTWWKKIGWVSRAFEPQRTMTSVSSTSL